MSRRRDTFTSWIVLAVVGVAICGVSLWQTWGVVPWVIGAGLLGLALIGLARAGSERSWVTVVAAVVGVAAVSFPFVLPYLGQSVPIQWSVDGEWALESSGDLVVTVTVDPDNPSPGDDGVAHMRAPVASCQDARVVSFVASDPDARVDGVARGPALAVVRVSSSAVSAWT